ncbi:ubiquitin-conjugating enzyme E2 S [Balamuthia mandrillaris]
MSSENLAPSVLRKIATEFRKLVTAPPEGIKLIPNESDITDVQATIEGPAGTPYEGGFFRVRLSLGPEFPQVPPKGYFMTKIFHPNVSNSGEICVNTLKRDWKEDLGIGHILLIVKCLLITPNPESSLNEEAGRLLLEDYEAYAKHARLMTSIHAKPKKTAVAATEDAAGCSSSDASASSTSSAAAKKRPANRATSSASSSAAAASKKKEDKSEKNKKRSLKRL